MSYTTIIHVFPGEKIECGDELRNSHGSAPVIWDLLCQKYLGIEPMHWMSGNMERLWKLWKDTSIPVHHRALLMMTFDRAYVLKANYARAAADIRKFFTEFQYNPEYVNHWPQISTLFESNPDVPAIGFWHTSVSDNPFHGSWNEDKEAYDSPDWDECYEIYSELDKLGG